MKHIKLLILIFVGLIAQGCSEFSPEGTEGGNPFAPEGTETGSLQKVTVDIQTAPLFHVAMGLHTTFCVTNITLIKADDTRQVFEINDIVKVENNWSVFAQHELELGFYREMVVETKWDCAPHKLHDIDWQPSVRMWYNQYHPMAADGSRAMDYYSNATVRFLLNQEITETVNYLTLDVIRLEDTWENVRNYQDMDDALQSGFLF